MKKTLYDVYINADLTKHFYLTIKHLNGETESKIYNNFKAVYAGIITDISPAEMMRLEVIDQRTEGKNIFLGLVEREKNLKTEEGLTC